MATEERKYIGGVCYARRYSKAELVRIEDDMSVPLTATQYKILAYFIDNINDPVTLDDLAQLLWGIHADEKGKENLKPQISRIRKKLEEIRVGLGSCIVTNYGFESYTMKVEEKQISGEKDRTNDELYTTYINKNEFKDSGYKPIPVSNEPKITLLLIRNMLFSSEPNWAVQITNSPLLHNVRTISSQPPDNRTFLKAILPEPVFQLILEEQSNNSDVIDKIVEGDCPDNIRLEICRSFTSDSGLRFRELRKKCKLLLMPPVNLSAFCFNAKFLFDHLDNKYVDHLRNCYQRCTDSGNTYSGLACLVFFALVGGEMFSQVIRNESDYVFFVDTM